MMTEKELRQEAEDYAKRQGSPLSETYGIRYRAYLDGAEPREKQLEKAKGHIEKLLNCLRQDTNDPQTNYYIGKYMAEAEQFLKG